MHNAPEKEIGTRNGMRGLAADVHGRTQIVRRVREESIIRRAPKRGRRLGCHHVATHEAWYG